MWVFRGLDASGLRFCGFVVLWVCFGVFLCFAGVRLFWWFYFVSFGNFGVCGVC